MRPSPSHQAFEKTELAWILIFFLAVVAFGLMAGCVSVNVPADEPFWQPHVFKHSPSESGRCQFVDGTGYVIDCEVTVMQDYYLAPLEDLVTLKSKLQQCETWR